MQFIAQGTLTVLFVEVFLCLFVIAVQVACAADEETDIPLTWKTLLMIPSFAGCALLVILDRAGFAESMNAISIIVAIASGMSFVVGLALFLKHVRDCVDARIEAKYAAKSLMS